MPFKKEDKLTDLDLERLSRVVSRSASMSDAEAGKAAAAPFLYARIRAGIETEKQARSAAGPTLGWLAPLLGLNKAAAGLAAAGIVGAAVFWAGYLRAAPHPPGPPQVEIAPQQMATACSISSTEACSVSSADVIEVLMGSGPFDIYMEVRR